jgi:hypothetical protein
LKFIIILSTLLTLVFSDTIMVVGEGNKNNSLYPKVQFTKSEVIVKSKTSDFFSSVTENRYSFNDYINIHCKDCIIISATMNIHYSNFVLNCKDK